MKKIVIFVVATLVSISSLVAQNYMVVDSKAIFDSLEEYTQALETLDSMGKEYQTKVDAKFEEVESLYNTYMQRISTLSTTEKKVYEAKITKMEAEATSYQESIFSQGGVFVQQRKELLSPIQERVFGVIEAYAKARNYDLVLDEASSSTVLYRSSEVNHTAGVIEELTK